MSKVLLYGAGEHASVVVDCFVAQDIEVAGAFDSNTAKSIQGVHQLGTYDRSILPGLPMVVAIGDNATRKKVARETSHGFSNAVHPSCLISPKSRIGKGNMILHGAIIQTSTTVADHVIINTGGRVDHDCVIESFAHLGPGSVLCGSVWVGEGALIGAGATLLPGVKIGAWAVVGAGSVVLADVPAGARVAGNPARLITGS
jgi:sugar O-acyltransferase (sialic acid O-acetyltransferase NeuD family)